MEEFRQLQVRPLTEIGEGDELILGVPDPGLSLATNGGDLRPCPSVEDALWLRWSSCRRSSSGTSQNRAMTPLRTPWVATAPHAYEREGGGRHGGKEGASCEGTMWKLLEIKFV
jgi:hypothetical protein